MKADEFVASSFETPAARAPQDEERVLMRSERAA